MPECDRMAAMWRFLYVGASRPEVLRQVIFADSETLASSGEPLFLSAFK